MKRNGGPNVASPNTDRHHSALTTIALFAGYCAADITDVAPGLLTLKPVAAPVFADPATAKSGGTVAGT